MDPHNAITDYLELGDPASAITILENIITGLVLTSVPNATSWTTDTVERDNGFVYDAGYVLVTDTTANHTVLNLHLTVDANTTPVDPLAADIAANALTQLSDLEGLLGRNSNHTTVISH